MIKIVTLFLIGIAILGIIGKLRLPRPGARRGVQSKFSVPTPRKCRDCGSYVIGTGPCQCKDRHQ